MRRACLATLALVAVGAVPRPAEAGLRDIFVESRFFTVVDGFLEDIGVDFDLNLNDLPDVPLPAIAEDAIASGLDRAESAVDRVFGEGGILDEVDVDLPDTIVPNLPDAPDVDSIVEDALDTAEQAVDQALDRAEAAVDRALSRASAVLDNIDQNVSDRVEGILEDALNRAEGVLDGIFGNPDPGPAGGFTSQSSTVNADFDRFFSADLFDADAITVVSPMPTPLPSRGAGVPEPTTLLLGGIGLTVAAAPRSRRR